jgi:hypothetical protein
MSRTYILVERRRSECVLSPDDVEFLIEKHGTHLRIVPTRQPNLFRITPTRLVGTILAPDSRLVLLPKLPLRSFATLLDIETGADAFTGIAHGWREEGILELLTRQLVRLAGERVAAGLHRSYREERTEGTLLEGSLDVPAQFRELPRRNVLHSRRDELTADVLCNQLTRSTLEALAGCPAFGNNLRSSLQRALADFDSISSVALNEDNLARALAERATVSYRPLLELCGLLADGMQAAAHGTGMAPAFLLDLERLFEGHVTRGIKTSFADSERLRVSAQPQFAFPPVQFRPDVVVREGARVRLVVDAKWKRLRPGKVIPSDFYQALAYAAALRAERVVLIYPGVHTLSWSVPLPPGSPAVSVQTLCVTGSPRRCRRALGRFAGALRCELENLY